MSRPKSHKREDWQSRIVGQDLVVPETLHANPHNWRVHTKAQKDALTAALDQIRPGRFSPSITI